MNGVHDMGGMHGFGPIDREAHENADWTRHVIALQRLTAYSYFNIDEFRYGIEQMPPAEYLRAPYFERWLATIEYNLIQKGYLTRDELDARTALLVETPAAELPRSASVPLHTPPRDGDA